MRFELYKSRNGWRFRLRARNGKIVANAGESYKRRIDCMKAVALVMETTLATPIAQIERAR